jgi:flavine halogenase
VIVALRFLVVVLSAYKQIRAQSKDILCDVGEDNFNRAFDFLRPSSIDHFQSYFSNSSIFPLVIQGNADIGPRLSEGEVQNALDFCASLFNPVNPGAADKLRKHLESLDRDTFSAHGLDRTGAEDVGSGEQTKQDGELAGPSLGGKPTHSPPTTPAVPGTLSFESTTLLMDPHSPLLPVEEIRNVARNPSLHLPLENGSAVEAQAEVQRMLEQMNARRFIRRENGDLHCLEEESLGAGYRMRLECGRLGLVQGNTVD